MTIQSIFADENQSDSRTLAIDSFKSLIKEHGTSWTSKTPKEAYDALKECNKVLNERDRKDAIASMR